MILFAKDVPDQTLKIVQNAFQMHIQVPLAFVSVNQSTTCGEIAASTSDHVEINVTRMLGVQMVLRIPIVLSVIKMPSSHLECVFANLNTLEITANLTMEHVLINATYVMDH